MLTDDEEIKDDFDESNDEANGKLVVDEDSGNGSPGKANLTAVASSSTAPPTNPSPGSSGSTAADAAAGSRSSTCDICSKTFKSSKSLQAHLYTDHPDEIY